METEKEDQAGTVTIGKHSICMVLMLTVAPLVTCATLVLVEPERWGGSFNPLAIAAMAFFGLFTVAIWPTYIPALVLTPVFMKKWASTKFFQKTPLLLLVALSAVVGAVAGNFVLAPLTFMNSHEPNLLLTWMSAGGLAGAITLSIISLLYRDRHR